VRPIFGLSRAGSEKDATVPLFAGESIAKGIFGTILYVIKSEGHFANVQSPEKFNPFFAGALGIPQDLVPKR
jgi:hypothetical protein